MKKMTVFLCLIFGLNLAGCGGTVSGDDTQTVSDPEDEVQTQTSGQSGMDTGQTTTQSDLEAGLKQYADAVPVVYMTGKITPESLLELYQSLGKKKKGKQTAVKISAGELSDDSTPDPELFQQLIQAVDGTIVTSSTRDDLQPVQDQGLAQIADVEVLDEGGSVTIPVGEGTHLTENYVGAHFSEYDNYLLISYFQGHAAAGFDGAVKNVSVGVSSAEGKCLIYSAGHSSSDPRGADQDMFLESMAEAGKSVSDALNGNILYINIMDHRAIDGGFANDAAEQSDREIGILASSDPVALDQASVDLVYMEDGSDTFVSWLEKLNGEYALEYAEEIGLGSSAYTLVSID